MAWHKSGTCTQSTRKKNVDQPSESHILPRMQTHLATLIYIYHPQRIRIVPFFFHLMDISNIVCTAQNAPYSKGKPFHTPQMAMQMRNNNVGMVYRGKWAGKLTYRTDCGTLRVMGWAGIGPRSPHTLCAQSCHLLTSPPQDVSIKMSINLCIMEVTN